MTFKPVAVDGMTVEPVERTSGTTATFTVLTSPSAKVSAKNGTFKGAYFGNIIVQITNATDGICTQTTPVNSAISPSSTVVTDGSGNKVVREGDTGTTVTVPGTSSGGGCTIAVTPEVTDAGQTKVEAQ